MSFILKVHIEGHCMLVRQDPVEVLVVDGRAPGRSTYGSVNHLSHIPLLRFPLSSVVGEIPEHYRLYNPLTEAPHGAIVLNEDVLRIDGDLVNHYKGGYGTIYDDSMEIVPRLSDLCRDTGGFELKQGCFDDRNLSAHNLIGRLQLPAGVIGVPDESISFHQYVFVPANDPDDERSTPQPLSERITYRTAVRSETVTLRRYRNGIELPGITLRPAAPDESVEVVLRNAPPFGQEIAKKLVGEQNDVDMDFELTYLPGLKMPDPPLVPKLKTLGNSNFPYICPPTTKP